MLQFLRVLILLMLFHNQLYANRHTTFAFNSGYLSGAFNSEIEIHTNLTEALLNPEQVVAVEISATTKNLAEVKRLNNLKFIFLDESFVTNSFYLTLEAINVFAGVLGQCKNLEYLSCCDGKLLAYFQDLNQLKGIKLNQVDQITLANTAGRFSKVEVLVINDSKISYLPEGISKFENLKQLEVYGLGITSLNLKTDQLVQLEVMKLMTGKTEKTAIDFRPLQNLRYLSITGLTSFFKFPAEIFNALNLLELHLDIRTARPIPNSIAQLKNLRVLGLHECQLLRSLPDSLPACTKIEKILLSDADFLSDVTSLNNMKQPFQLIMNRCDYTGISKQLIKNEQLKAIAVPSSTPDKTLNKLNELLTPERVLTF